MASIMQEKLEIKDERYEFSIIQYKGEPKSVASLTEKIPSLSELKHIVSLDFC